MQASLLALCMALLVAGSARAADGPALYAQNCLMCHQSGGAGLVGQFPRLADRVALISNKPKGRSYLIAVLTSGMAGNIKVDGQDIMGFMPPFAQLSDDEVAAILNYAQSLGQQPKRARAAFEAAEVHAVRAQPPKTAAEVHAQRQQLGLDKLKP